MKLNIFVISTILLFSMSFFAQENKPEREGVAHPVEESSSSLYDIRYARTAYIVTAKAADGKVIERALNNEFILAGKAPEAEFFIEYKRLTGTGGEMQVYHFKDSKKVIVWADRRAIKKTSLTQMVKEFLQVFERNKALTKPSAVKPISDTR